jgi:hypothetical protein
VKPWACLWLAVGLGLLTAPAARAVDCTPANIRRALDEDHPPALLRVADLPAAVLDEFWRSYGALDPDHRIADPGQRFQETDVVQDELPWRRLIVAAASPRAAFLAYEKGGRAKTRHLFAVCLAGGKAVGSYSALRAPNTFERSALSEALREGCLVSPPREHGLPGDATRCPPAAAPAAP